VTSYNSSKPRKHILLVDDDVDIQKIFRHICDTHPHLHLSIASTGAEALDIIQQAREQNDVPELIILDIFLTDMDGFALSEKIAKTGVQIPVVASTAYYNHDIHRLISQAFMEYWPKPLDWGMVIQRLVN